MKISELYEAKAVKQRLDPKCWKGKHKEGTKIKGGVRVNNCVPNESVDEGVAENVDIGLEWMSDTELDQYVPDALEQEWRELVGYDEDGNAHPLWISMTGDYEPNSNDPQHRAWMVKIANKWFGMKKIPNVRFFDVKDTGDELEWLVQIGQQGVAEAANAAQQAAIAISMKKAGKKPKHKEEELDEGLFLESQFDIIEEMIADFAEFHSVDEDVIWEDIESVDDEELLAEAEAWQTSKGKNKNGGLNKKGVASYRRSHPGSKLQTAVTTKPSKLKKGSKAAKRRKSFCARMRGMKKHRTSAKTARDPDSRINKSLRKWHCEHQELNDILRLSGI